MGDEAREGSAFVTQIVAAPRSPYRKRRRGGEEELCRAAEIVLVLAAMGEMRAGREPTTVEKAMSAEARTMLTRACEQVRPKDLFSSEDVRVLVEDLGLNRLIDPGMAFRPSKMSIADRLQHTKKEMEESRDFTVSVHSSLPHSLSIGSNSEPQRLMAGKSSPMVLAAGGSNNSTAVHISTLASSLPIMKQSTANEAQTAIAPSFKKDLSSVVSSVEAINQRLDARINGPTYFTLVRPTTGTNYLMENVTASAISTPTAVVTQSQPSNSQGNNHEVKVIQGSHQMIKTFDVKGPTVQATQVQMAMGNQTSQGLTFLHVPTFISNHNEIAKRIMGVVQSKIPDFPNLPLSSAEYMTKPLNCQVCKIIITDAESLLVCDACEKGIHLKCLQFQGTKVIPKFDWHCPKCLLASNCKPFPRRYGRILKATSAEKATISEDGASILVDKNGEISEATFYHEKTVENQNLTSSRVAQEPDFDDKLGEIVIETMETIRKVSEESISSSCNRPIEGLNSGSSINHLEANSELASATPEAQTEISDTQTAIIKLPDTEATKDHFDSQFRGFDKSEQIHLFTSEISRPFSESMIDIKAQSEHGCSSKKYATLTEFTCKYQSTTDSHVIKEENMSITPESANDLAQETRPPITDDLKDTLNSSEIITNQVLKVDLDGEDGSQMMHDQVLENGSDTAYCEKYSKEDLQNFDWFGDILEAVNDRTYYTSCCINGCIIKLQDNVLISANSQIFYPAKLLSLWEDNEVCSKFAIVNEYCLPGNLPEGISQPLIPEKDEVYASDARITILASSIRGLCTVLPEDKFRKEIEGRNLLTDQAGVPQSVFMCKWLFDESKGVFHSYDLYL